MTNYKFVSPTLARACRRSKETVRSQIGKRSIKRSRGWYAVYMRLELYADRMTNLPLQATADYRSWLRDILRHKFKEGL